MAEESIVGGGLLGPGLGPQADCEGSLVVAGSRHVRPTRQDQDMLDSLDRKKLPHNSTDDIAYCAVTSAALSSSCAKQFSDLSFNVTGR